LKVLRKYILFLILLNVLTAVAGILVVTLTGVQLQFHDIVILSTSFSAISLVTMIIFLKGQMKDPQSQTLYSLVAIVLKFLLEMVLALMWFIVAKKNSMPSVFIFFVLYLTLTLFSVMSMLKILKNKPL